MSAQASSEQEDEEDLALDRRVYGNCYWKVVDGKKVRIHPMDVRIGRDGVPRDSSNTAAEWQPFKCPRCHGNLRRQLMGTWACDGCGTRL